MCFSTEMRALTLKQANVAQGEHQQALFGGSLSSNFAPLNLENVLLAQSSTLITQPRSPFQKFEAQPSSCHSLQPSHLSSTSSSLLSTSSCLPSLSSPLLSTENKLLNSYTSVSLSLTAVPNDSLLCTSLASSHLLNRFSKPASSLYCDLGGEQKGPDGAGKDEEETSEGMQFSFEETSMVHNPVSFKTFKSGKFALVAYVVI